MFFRTFPLLSSLSDKSKQGCYMTIDSALTKNVIKVICFLSRINEIMKQLISNCRLHHM